MNDTDEKREALVAELVRTMNRKPKNPTEVEKRTQACKRLQAEIDELRHAGDR